MRPGLPRTDSGGARARGEGTVGVGEGIGFTLPHLASLEVFSGSDAVVALPARDFRWGFGASYLKAHTPGPREEDLIEYLEQRVARRMRAKA